VVCIDEKTLDRTAPILPIRPGVPEKQTHDYKRNGTTTLFAALEVATGLVTDRCFQRHTNVEFLAFLKQVARAYPRVELHVVCDNYATHKHPNVQAWLAKHPRVHMHFTPTSGSWLNMVEIFFGIITRQAIRRGTFHSVKDLETAIGVLHRRLERARPPVHLDQGRRRDHRPRQILTPPEKDLQPATLEGPRHLAHTLAAVFVAEIGDVTRFASALKLTC